MKQTQGLTLIEVLIGIAIFAVGVLAAAQLQVSALQGSGDAEALKQVTSVVSAELEWRRQTASQDVGESNCQSVVPSSFSECRVTIEPCYIPPTSSAFVCSAGVVSPVAYRVNVSATGPKQKQFDLTSTYTGIYVAGAAGAAKDTFDYFNTSATEGESSDATATEGAPVNE